MAGVNGEGRTRQRHSFRLGGIAFLLGHPLQGFSLPRTSMPWTCPVLALCVSLSSLCSCPLIHERDGTCMSCISRWSPMTTDQMCSTSGPLGARSDLQLLFPSVHNCRTKIPLLAFTPAFSVTQEGHCPCHWSKL